MSVEVVTFGCRLNAFESEVMRVKAERVGLADTVVINSCAVTNEAVAQVRQSIRRLKRERPGLRIVVTGCAAQTLPEMFAAMEEVDRVVGNHDKMQAETWRNARAALETAGKFSLEASQKIAVAVTSSATSIAAQGQPSEKKLPEVCHGKSVDSPAKTATPPTGSSTQRGMTALEPGTICPDRLTANKIPPPARIAEMPPS